MPGRSCPQTCGILPVGSLSPRTELFPSQPSMEARAPAALQTLVLSGLQQTLLYNSWDTQSEANAMWSPMEELQLNIWMVLHARASTGFTNLPTPNFSSRVLLKYKSCQGLGREQHQDVLWLCGVIFPTAFVRCWSLDPHGKVLPPQLQWAKTQPPTLPSEIRFHPLWKAMMVSLPPAPVSPDLCTNLHVIAGCYNLLFLAQDFSVLTNS